MVPGRCSSQPPPSAGRDMSDIRYQLLRRAASAAQEGAGFRAGVTIFLS